MVISRRVSRVRHPQRDALASASRDAAGVVTRGMTEREAFASTGEDADDADTAEMEKLEELIDRVKVTPPGEVRRALLLELAAAVTADARAADFADAHGGRDLLLKSMDGAMRVGDEELMDAVGAAVAARSRCADATDAMELLAVGGSQVGAASQRPPGVEVVRLHKAEADVHVHESAWSDAGLAWRIWGASRIMAHALDAAAHAERSNATPGRDSRQVTKTSPGFPETLDRGKSEPKRRELRVQTRADPPFMRVRGARVLELGAGCGLGGLAAAAVGAKEVVITEGAPGALAALARSAEAASETVCATLNKNDDGVAPRVAFLDWRDDQAALEAETRNRGIETDGNTHSDSDRKIDDVGDADPRDRNRNGALPRVESGTSVLEIGARFGLAKDGKVVTETCPPFSSRETSGRVSRNWVHKLRGGAQTLASLPRLGEDETFDVIIGSDLLYDEAHCAPLAACLARRLEKAEAARAHVVLAVRRGALIAELCTRAHERWGLRFEVRALDVFEEERLVLAQQQGGHIAREETPGAEAWRVAGGEAFALAKTPVFASSSSDEDGSSDDEETDRPGVVNDASSVAVKDGLCGLQAEIAKLEGRVAMVSFRWPRRRVRDG